MPVWGSWDIASYDSKVVAIHACLLHNGKVLFFAGRSYPLNSKIAPPGYYMLFILKPKSESNSGLNKIPSEAVFVHIM